MMRLSPYFRLRSIRNIAAFIGLFLVISTFLNYILSTFVDNQQADGSLPSPDSAKLHKTVLELSKRYLAALAKEQKDVPDHRYSGLNTQFDLKKTLAVLLDSILQRLSKLESRVQQHVKNNSHQFAGVSSGRFRNSDRPMVAGDILDGAQESCQLPANWKARFPNCEEKIKWMEGFWKSDPCYVALGVDGSRCSFIIYLGEVESHCPPLSWRSVPTHRADNRPELASAPLGLETLFALMKDNPLNYEWIKMRISRMWPMWTEAHRSLELKQNWTLVNRRRKTILLHLGFLTKESGFKFGEKSLKGGPLGELVQWSDLIASLYLLGHHLVISSEIKTFVTFAQADPAMKSSCPTRGNRHVDLVYTDIVGLRQMKKKMAASLQNYRCRLRVLDSFGTEAQFNYMPYFTKHKLEIGGHKRNAWGGHSLNLQQFYTMYPHSPDNTFLGFVVETPLSERNISEQNITRMPAVLVYGKEAYMWEGKATYLDAVRRVAEIHGTVGEDKKFRIPSYVKNHGVLNSRQFHLLLRQMKVFLGLGFPYEGPAALEAIANGAILLHPHFKVPKNRKTEKFFQEKPTLRSLHSQNPYADDFIGEPYVLSVDAENSSAVELAVRKALQTDIQPFLPYEFTAEGMVERVNAFVTHQDFCSTPASNWPPFSAQRVVVSAQGVSCKDACWTRNMICEPSYFPKANSEDAFREYGSSVLAPCAKFERDDDLSAPSQGTQNGSSCFLQSQPLLFSCAYAEPLRRRLCPCRDYIKDQVALCAACL